MTLQASQRRGLPKDDLKPYAGRWVALREGYVVASALDPVTVRDDPVVCETDMILLVPMQPGQTYVFAADGGGYRGSRSRL